MIVGKENTEYAYAVGRIRALETRLLTRAVVDRMLEAADMDELFRILADTSYGTILSETAEYQRLLEVEETRSVELFDELCLDPTLSELIHYRYDFHNLKVLMKAYIAKSEEEFNYALSPRGNFDISFLKGVFGEEKFGALPEILQLTINRALGEYYSKEDPRLIDLIVDQEMFQFCADQISKMKNDFLTQLLALIIDLTNIKTLARVKRLEEDKETLRLAFFDGGNLRPGWYVNMAEEPWENLSHRFYATPYFYLIEEGYGYLQSEKSYLKLEKMCDDFLIDWLRNTRYRWLGVEPLVAYFLAKLNELKILRLLFVGKLHGIEPNRIKERLPDVF